MMQRAVSLSVSVSRRLLAAARSPSTAPRTRTLRSSATAHRPARDNPETPARGNPETPARGNPETPARGNPAPIPAPAARDGRATFNLNGRIPSAYDRKVLLWVGRFKKDQDIPDMVSIEMLYAARNKIRVQICYLMIAVSVVACVVMVASGKKAFKQRENLTKWNMEKKAKLREQYMLEQEAAAEKPQ
ncbi:protein FAM162B-like [Rhinoraja longicauda]